MDIRIEKSKDFEELTSIWLEASIEAHDFIPSEFWSSKVEAMKNIYLPASENWILENENQEILGFVSMLKIILLLYSFLQNISQMVMGSNFWILLNRNTIH